MDDRAVSPVIGVVILVAVVVILSSVLGAHALGYTQLVRQGPPQADFTLDWEESTRTLTIEHAAGDSFTPENTNRLEVVIEDEDETGGNDYLVARGDWASRGGGGFPIEAGSTFTITGENGGGDLDVELAGTNVNNPGTETHEPEVRDIVRVIWYSDDRSFVLVEYTIPAGED